MVRTFQEQLQSVLRDGNLTVADLARWFGRSDPTVRGWVQGGGLGGPSQDKVEVRERLHDLEVRIRKRKGLPVPRLSPRERIAYLAKMAAGRPSHSHHKGLLA